MVLNFIKKIVTLYLRAITILLKKAGVLGTFIALVMVVAPIEFVVENSEKLYASEYFVPIVVFILIVVVFMIVTRYKKSSNLKVTKND